MNKNLGPFAQSVQQILQAYFPQIKLDTLEEAVERIDLAAKDSVEIREYWIGRK